MGPPRGARRGARLRRLSRFAAKRQCDRRPRTCERRIASRLQSVPCRYGAARRCRGHPRRPRAVRDAARRELAGRGFDALGVSLVLHPRNPYVPTVHLNVRLFVARAPTTRQRPIWWFGGGMDLTPYYGFADDAVHFHRACRDALAPFGDDLYPKYKRGCDDYFFLKHRGEPRGIGGIFFDDLADGGFERCFALTKSVGDHFLSGYEPIL